MKSMGYSGSVFNIIETKLLSENITSVDVDWKVMLESGVYEFKALYLCHKNQDQWSIFNAVVYNKSQF